MPCGNFSSSKDIPKRRVGTIRRITAAHVQVIRLSRIRCRKVNRGGGAESSSFICAGISGGFDALTTVFYRFRVCSFSEMHALEGMQIGQQVLHLLLREHLTKTRHGIAPVDHNFAYAVVRCRQTTFLQEGTLEDSLQAGAFFPARGVGLMAAIAIMIVKLAPGGLLRIQAEFSVAFAQLGIASGEK